MKEALYFMARGACVPLDSVNMDPPTSYMGETPYVYPGAAANSQPEYRARMSLHGVGQADPAAEEAFNGWMDAYMGWPPARQQGENSALVAQERAGTLDAMGVRKLKFIRAMSGEAPVPDLTKQEIAQAKPIEELNIVGQRKSGLAIFLAALGLGAVAALAAGKSGR
jgi:hypothetical protein